MKYSQIQLQSTVISPFASLKRNSTQLASTKVSIFSKSQMTSKTSVLLPSNVEQQCDKKTVYKSYSKGKEFEPKIIPKAEPTDAPPQSFANQVHIDTTSIQKIIERNLMEDQKCAQKTIRRAGKNHRYIYQPNPIDLAISSQRLMPKEVTQFYQECQKGSKTQKVQFQQGYLPNTELIYFSIDKAVFFYDAKQLYHEQKSQCIEVIQFQDHVLFIQEIHCSKAYKLFDNKIKSMLLFAFPYKISLFPFLQSIVSTLNAIKSQIGIGIQYGLNSDKPSHFILDQNENMYYLDANGSLNSLLIYQETTAFLFKTGKYSLRKQKANSIGLKTFSQNCSRIFSKSLMHFWKEIKDYGKSLFADQMKIFNLFYDPNQKIIFTLTSFQLSNSIFSQKYQKNYKQFVTAYKIENGSAQFLYNMTAEQIIQNFVGVSIQRIRNIKNIYLIDKIHSKSSNILIVFESGARVYALATRQKWNSIEKIDPPDLSKLNLQKKNSKPKKQDRDSQQSTFQKVIISKPPQKGQILQAVSFQNGRLIMILKYYRDIYTLRINFFKSKNNQQNEILRLIPWCNPQNIPHQFLIYQCKKEIPEMEQCLNIGDCLCKESSNTSILYHLNDYARQVYSKPEECIFSSDMYRKKVIMTRPIDIMVTIINQFKSIISISRTIITIFDKIPRKEIISMLTQILFDSNGAYYIFQRVKQQLQLLQKKQTSFIKYPNLNQDQQKTKNTYQILYHNPKISIDKSSLILQLMEQIAKQEIMISNSQQSTSSEDNRRSNESEIENKSTPKKQFQKQILFQPEQIMLQGMLLYFSRYLRPIWFKNINCFRSVFARQAILKIKEFSKIIDKISKRHQRLKTIQNYGILMAFLNKIDQLFMLLLSIDNLPQISFGEALFRQSSFFEESIFKFIIKNYKGSIVDEMKRYFPTYFNKTLFKSCKTYLQIKDEYSQGKILQICKKFNGIPRYFLVYLKQFNKLSQKQILGIQMNEPQNFHRCRITLPSQGTYLSQYLQTLDEIKGSNRDISQKQALLEHARDKFQNHLKFEKSSTSLEYQQRSEQQINEIDKTLQFQRILINEYERISKAERDQLYKPNLLVSVLTAASERESKGYYQWEKEQQSITQSLEQNLYDREVLLKMAASLKPYALEVIYFQIMEPQNQSKISQKLQNLLQFHQKDTNCKKIIQKQLEFISISTKNKIPVSILLENCSKFLLKSLQMTKVLNEILNAQKLKELNVSQFWLGSFLAEIGYKKSEIYEFYHQKIQNIFQPTLQIKYQSQLVFSILNCYCFVVDYNEQNQERFGQFSVSLLRKMSNRSSDEVMHALQRILLKLF